MALSTERLAQLVAERDAAAAAASAAASAASADAAARLAAAEAAGVAIAEDVLDWTQIQLIAAIPANETWRLRELLMNWRLSDDLRHNAAAYITGVTSVRDAVLAE